MADNQSSCDSCGLLFDTADDVQRHIKRDWSPESNNEPPAKKRKIDEESDNDLDDDLEENMAFLQLWKIAKKRLMKMVDQLIKDGEEEDDAREGLQMIVLNFTRSEPFLRNMQCY